MKKSLQLAIVAGIPIKIHWSFSLLILFIVYVGVQNKLGVEGTLWFGAVMISLFFCVLLHEYGHALTAKVFGVKTKDIILSPLGGMARLEKLPDKPMHEFYVAIAGPAVNIVIAFFLGLYITLFLSSSFWINTTHIEFLFNGKDFIKLMFWMPLLLRKFIDQ